MSVTRIKLCGFTREEDIRVAVEAGADAIGLVFYEPSKRNVSIEQARELSSLVPAFVSLVGLFVDADPKFVQSVLNEVPLSLLQFHGRESAEYCESFARPYIRAIRFKNEASTNSTEQNLELLESEIKGHKQARGFLIDSYHPEQAGGTGEAFNWADLSGKAENQLILAGGLSVENVSEAIRQVRPYAVDVSSGIETEPGIKSAEKIKAFIQAVRG